jgi:hypothetical protein
MIAAANLPFESRYEVLGAEQIIGTTLGGPIDRVAGRMRPDSARSRLGFSS